MFNNVINNGGAVNHGAIAGSEQIGRDQIGEERPNIIVRAVRHVMSMPATVILAAVVLPCALIGLFKAGSPTLSRYTRETDSLEGIDFTADNQTSNASRILTPADIPAHLESIFDAAEWLNSTQDANKTIPTNWLFTNSACEQAVVPMIMGNTTEFILPSNETEIEDLQTHSQWRKVLSNGQMLAEVELNEEQIYSAVGTMMKAQVNGCVVNFAIDPANVPANMDAAKQAISNKQAVDSAFDKEVSNNHCFAIEEEKIYGVNADGEQVFQAQLVACNPQNSRAKRDLNAETPKIDTGIKEALDGLRETYCGDEISVIGDFGSIDSPVQRVKDSILNICPNMTVSILSSQSDILNMTSTTSLTRALLAANDSRPIIIATDSELDAADPTQIEAVVAQLKETFNATVFATEESGLVGGVEGIIGISNVGTAIAYTSKRVQDLVNQDINATVFATEEPMAYTSKPVQDITTVFAKEESTAYTSKSVQDITLNPKSADTQPVIFVLGGVCFVMLAAGILAGVKKAKQVSWNPQEAQTDPENGIELQVIASNEETALLEEQEAANQSAEEQTSSVDMPFVDSESSSSMSLDDESAPLLTGSVASSIENLAIEGSLNKSVSSSSISVSEEQVMSSSEESLHAQARDIIFSSDTKLERSTSVPNLHQAKANSTTRAVSSLALASIVEDEIVAQSPRAESSENLSSTSSSISETEELLTTIESEVSELDHTEKGFYPAALKMRWKKHSMTDLAHLQENFKAKVSKETAEENEEKLAALQKQMQAFAAKREAERTARDTK